MHETNFVKSTMQTLDFRIIELLQENGRQSNTDIARELDVSEATVRKRINDLINDRTIQIVAYADPLKIGLPLWVDIEIQAELGRVDEIAAKLATFPEVHFVGVVTGAFDVAAGASFRSNEHLHEFLSKKLGSIRGVRRTVTSIFLKVVKRSFKYVVPTDGQTPGSLPSHSRADPGRTRGSGSAGKEKRIRKLPYKEA